ncbi:hypothetical protein [Exiguobacterium sp. s37]|uniref:hypothetical protein n=1 Tax=Exiguobacterium sp. s37 TaxID=2751275 RepID=UPI001BE7D3B1|nr:hypothetical protein [Exiguobacterium sp. s37]
MNYVVIERMAEDIAKFVWENHEMRRNLKDVRWNGIEEMNDLKENLRWKLTKELKVMEKLERASQENVVGMLVKHFDNIMDPQKVVPIRESVKTSLFE